MYSYSCAVESACEPAQAADALAIGAHQKGQDAYVISVRELCAFAAKAGDLDLRFTPSPTASQGMAGHRTVATRRGSARRAELPVQLDYRSLRVRGRADGFDEAESHLDEVKTHRGSLERIPANHRALHWAQAKVYGWMVCQRLGLERLRVSVVYFEVDSQCETAFTENIEAGGLRTFFEALCDHFIAWAELEVAHRGRRDAWLRQLTWPFPDYRAGQRHLATSVYNAVRSRRHLLAQAPTGIGKTLATLFPMLKAMPGHEGCRPLDKVFYLTAKTTGRQLALDALAKVRSTATHGAPLRVVTLVARDKACEHPNKQCHGESCPLARGFYDRLPNARAEAVSALEQEPAGIREVALRHQVCPYYLAQEMTRWADVVVADYNYLFDVTALLHSLTVENEWQVGVLVDEAHNLVSRARDMYTAELTLARLRNARREAPSSLRSALTRLRRAWTAAVGKQTDAFHVYEQPPEALLEALRGLVAQVGDLMAQEPAAVSGDLLQLHFDALHFISLAESFDDSSQFDVTLQTPGARQQTDATLCVRNVVPATFLQGRFKSTQATVLFSATLTPFEYQRSMLGLPDSTAALDVDSPFTAEQLSIRVAHDVSTRFSDRAASLRRLAQLIADQYCAAPGNYLAYFSSFEYLAQVARELVELAPDLPVRLQERRMREFERQAFVDSFVDDGTQVGFAVLGGAFGEGLDLPGSRLIGAFIATLGLPQMNPVNESMRRKMQLLFGDGYGYAYLYPGVQKVVQAAGRVIRTPQDRGVLHLMDDRFQRPEVRALLPAWWRVEGAAAAGGRQRNGQSEPVGL
jgi:DNA excision repair protein ERCC-2